MQELSIVCVTFNSAHCIADLAKGIHDFKHIFIVDNASEDDLQAQLSKHLPQATLLRNDQNLGFGAANNRALAQVQTPYALLLNPDCLPESKAIEQLLQTAKQFPEAAITAPHLLRRGGEIELSYRWPATHWSSKGPTSQGPTCVGFVCGAAMLLNMAVMKNVGFFDEGFFLYYEDEDLCQRVFLAGKAIVLDPHVQIQHLSRGSVRGPQPARYEYLRGYHHAQSKLRFEAKYFGKQSAQRLRSKTLFLACLTLLPRLLLLQPRYLARLWGRIRGLLQAKAMLP